MEEPDGEAEPGRPAPEPAEPGPEPGGPGARAKRASVSERRISIASRREAAAATRAEARRLAPARAEPVELRDEIAAAKAAAARAVCVVPRTMIGVIGDTNAGKTMFLNAVLGRRLLPSAAMSSTSVFTHVVLDQTHDGEPELHVPLQVSASGADPVRQAMRDLNDRIRADVNAEEITEAFLKCPAEGSLAALSDGTVHFVDVPGHNETSTRPLRSASAWSRASATACSSWSSTTR